MNEENKIEQNKHEGIQRILHDKKPAFWLLAAVLVVCAVLTGCFLTHPKKPSSAVDASGPSLVFDGILYLSSGEEETIEPDDSAILGRIASTVPADQLPKEDWQANFDALGAPVAGMDGRLYVLLDEEWIRFEPASDRTEEPDWYSAVRWFDCLHGDKLNWGETKETELEAFPEVVFRWNQNELTAVTDQGETQLFVGMPIWSVYFCDLTGDGKPELCGCRSIGSGMISYDVVFYDYAEGLCAQLSGRDHYILNLRSGMLTVEKRGHSQNLVCDERIEEIGSLKLTGTLLRFLPEPQDPEAQRCSFRAELLERSGEAVLVRPESGSVEARSSDTIWVSGRLLLTPFVTIGDMLEIEYNGEIMESYPAQLGEIYSIRIVEHSLLQQTTNKE